MISNNAKGNLKMDNVNVIKIIDNDTLKESLKIRNEVFTVEKGVPNDIEVDEYDNLNDKCDHFIIEYDSNKVGTLRCKIKDDIIQLQRYCFLKEYRNLGIGKITLEYIENYYKNLNKKKIVLDAKYSVCEFYKKCGYKVASDIFNEAGIQHMKMEKELF